MPHFGRRSKMHLISCHADLQTIFNEVVRDYDCSIIMGRRGKEEQERLYHAGLSKKNWPNSYHNSSPSMATDVVPYPIVLHGRNLWKEENHHRFYHFIGFVLATAQQLYRRNKICHLLRSGSDWDYDNDLRDQTFYDLPHYELFAPEE